MKIHFVYFQNSNVFFTGHMGQTQHKLKISVPSKLTNSGILYINKIILLYSNCCDLANKEFSSTVFFILLIFLLAPILGVIFKTVLSEFSY